MQFNSVTKTKFDSEVDSEEEKSFIGRLTGVFNKNKMKENEEEEEDEEEDKEVEVDTVTPKQVKASGAHLGKIKPTKVSISPYLIKKRAGLIIRLMGFILNICAVYSIYIYVIPQLKVESFF